MKKKVVVLGGGTGLSNLLRGLKEFPVDITAIVSTCDDGKSTGRLREEFDQPAVGDLRRVIIALSETESLFQNLFNYRFKTTSDLNGHTVGNLFLTAMMDMTGDMATGIKSLEKVLNLKGHVVPFSEDNIVLMAKMTDGTIVEGEHNITEAKKVIEKLYYKEEPHVCKEAIKAIKEADLIILSIGSVYTSIIPNLISTEIRDALDKSKAKIMYCCNIVTQPGETDDLSASEHVKLLNKYLGEKKIGVGVFNNRALDPKLAKKYETEEQKDPVIFDKENLTDIDIIEDDLVTLKDGTFKHEPIKLAMNIFEYLLRK